MSASLAEEIRIKIRDLLKKEEEDTDLDNLSVLSRVGMKVSSADSIELNADASSASSTALIDLGLRLSESTNHGSLKEIILHNKSGYSILMAINDEYIIFGALNAMYRIGYYLGYLRELTRKLNYIISGGEPTNMTLSLEEEELEKIRKQKEKEKEEQEEEVLIKKPSVEEDKEALDGLLGFLDEWEKEGLQEDQLQPENEQNIVSIPGETTNEIETEALDIEEEPEQPPPSTEFPVYEDEVPPIPLDDYEPMEVGEEPSIEEEIGTPPPPEPQPTLSPETQEEPSSEELPSLDELTPPDFDSQVAEEYDTEFILEEESESLDAVLKDLGWDEEE
jgi:predicted regulator of Ras-like GTPase activity (Roadblock/LC7/MglB family)